MMEYVVVPVVVDAVQPYWDEDGLPDWVVEAVRRRFIRMHKGRLEVMVDTDDFANGHYQVVRSTDWIVRVNESKFLVIDADSFNVWFKVCGKESE